MKCESLYSDAPQCKKASTQSIHSGHVHVPIEFDERPHDYVFALVPNFSMHSFSAAVEPLRIANQLTGKTLFHWETRSLDGLPVLASNGLALSSDGTFEDLPKGSRLIVCSGDNAEALIPQELANWIRMSWRRGHVVGGLCTGAYALKQAGILQGHDFTLHWECQPAFEEMHPDLSPNPAAFVVDKRVVTSGGGVGSTDLMLHLIEMEFGRALRFAVADMCLQLHVRSPSEAQRSLAAKAYGLQNPKLAQAIDYVQDHLQEEFEVIEWAEHLKISRRQLERMFKSYTGMSPKKFVTGLRMEHAYALLVGTNLNVTEVSHAVGLSQSSFSAAFKKRFGIHPHNLTRQVA